MMVVVQSWVESELGWGIRPDGVSVHRSEQDRLQYIKEYWDKMPHSVPNEYSRPSGQPKLIEIPDPGPDFEGSPSKYGIRYYAIPKWLV